MTTVPSNMSIASAVATDVHAEDLAEQLANQVRAGLGGRRVDLCLVFASAHFEDRLDGLALDLHDRLSARHFIGVTAEAVIAGDREYEHQPALVVWVAHLPGVQAASFHLAQEDMADWRAPEDIREDLGIPADVAPHFVLLADPFSFNPTPALAALLGHLHDAYPTRPVLGGLASAAEAPGQNRLLFGGQTLHHGAVGVALWGDITVDAIVSQGCRPIGQHMVITRAEQNVIYELGGRSPLEVIRQLIAAMEPRDRRLLRQRGLLVGRAINEHQQRFVQGDFLIRNLIGFDPDSGAMAVNDLIRTGQTVQFHVRDGLSASENLEALVFGVRDRAPAGALLFTCNGRGTSLFPEPSHDARLVRGVTGDIPVAGCFCAGEIGPAGSRNFIHGHAASIGFFRPGKAHPDG